MENFPTLPQENTAEQSHIKEGVNFVFSEHPALEKIGTKEQYSNYLETIFPQSKIKDITYHGTGEGERFESFDTSKGVHAPNFGRGIYVTTDKLELEKYTRRGGHIVSLMVDVQNPLITGNRSNGYYGAFDTGMKKGEKLSDYIDNDSVINYTDLDRDSFKKINNYMIEYIGEKNELGFPAYQKAIYKKPEIREIVVEDTNQAHILGSRKDMEKFKEFVGE